MLVFRQVCFADVGLSSPLSLAVYVYHFFLNLCYWVAKITKKIKSLIWIRTLQSNGASPVLLVLEHNIHFQGQNLVIYFSEYLADGERYTKHYYCHEIGSQASAIERRQCECCAS